LHLRSALVLFSRFQKICSGCCTVAAHDQKDARGEWRPFSELLSKLTDLSSERSDAHKEGSFGLRGEEVARLAKFLGVDMSRISELLGKDITRLSKLVDENMKMNTRVNLGDARSGGYQSTDERVSDGKRSGASNKAGKKKVKGPKEQRKVKRVWGPKAQRRRNNR
jgi:hypothetical protein